MNLNSFRSWRLYLVLGALGFLLYFEDRVHLSSYSLSNLWRLLLLSILILASTVAATKRDIPLLILILILLPLSLLVNTSLPTITDIEEVLTELFLPGVIITSYYYMPLRLIEKTQLYLAIVLSLISIPYYLNLLEPVELEINSSLNNFSTSFGFERDPFVGVFKHPSYAGKTLITIIVVLLFSSKDSLNRITYPWLIVTTVAGVYLSYVRTSWLMLVIIFFFLRKLLLQYFKRIVVILPVILVFVLALFSTDWSGVMNRILGIRAIGVEVNWLTALTSGRNLLYYRAYELIKGLNVPELLFGLGKSQADTLLGGVAHNRFLELFLYGGIKSVFLSIVVFYNLFKCAGRNTGYRHRQLLLFSALLLFSYLPSHGFPFWSNVLFGLSISMVLKHDSITKEA